MKDWWWIDESAPGASMLGKDTQCKYTACRHTLRSVCSEGQEKREKLLIEISPSQVGGTDSAKQGKVIKRRCCIESLHNHLLPLRQCDGGSSRGARRGFLGFDEN
jgi:hypothetical protein